MEQKLYSPTFSKIWGYDSRGNDTTTEISQYDAADYIGEIKSMVFKENEYFDSPRGLMEYYDADDSVNKKVTSFFPNIEVINGQLWGVAEIEVTEPLLPQEMALLKDYAIGQYADGWGEGFEQRDIDVDDGNLNVSFWSSDNSFFIVGESEFSRRLEVSSYGTPKVTADEIAGLRSQLIECIDRNIDDYYNGNKSDGINNQALDEAMENAHYILREYHDYTFEQVDCLLRFANPLEIVAEQVKGTTPSVGDLSAVLDYIYDNRLWFVETCIIVDNVSTVEEIADKSDFDPEPPDEYYEQLFSDNYDRIIPAVHLPEGWEWRLYNDGSGGLYSPENEEAVRVDFATSEYKRGGKWHFIDDYPYETISSGEFMENMEKRLSAVVERENKPEEAPDIAELRSQLVERIDKNIDEYYKNNKNEGITKQAFDGAMENAHYILREYHDYTSEQLECLLKFANPLEIVVEQVKDTTPLVNDLPPILDHIYENRFWFIDNYLTVDKVPPVEETLDILIDTNSADIYELRNQLIERAAQNWDDYRNSPHTTTPDTLFNTSVEVINRRDAYVFVKDYQDYTVEQLTCLLQFANPVEVVADYLDPMSDGSEMAFILSSILEKQDYYKQHYAMSEILTDNNDIITNKENETVLKTALFDRIDKNLSDYCESLMVFDRSEIVGMAEEIASRYAVRDYLQNTYEFNAGDVDYLLQFKDPLTVVSDGVLLQGKSMLPLNIGEAVNTTLADKNTPSGYSLVADTDTAVNENTAELREQLVGKANNEYERYHHGLLALDKADIIAKSDYTVAIETARQYITEYKNYTADDLEFLSNLEFPLTAVADQVHQMAGENVDFPMILEFLKDNYDDIYEKQSDNLEAERVSLQNKLIERVEENLADYRDDLRSSSPKEILDIALSIYATNEAYYFLKNDGYFTAEQSQFLLKFENPLEIFADYWQSEVNIVDFSAVTDKIFDHTNEVEEYHKLSDKPPVVAKKPDISENGLSKAERFFTGVAERFEEYVRNNPIVTEKSDKSGEKPLTGMAKLRAAEKEKRDNPLPSIQKDTIDITDCKKPDLDL